MFIDLPTLFLAQLIYLECHHNFLIQKMIALQRLVLADSPTPKGIWLTLIKLLKR